MFRWLRDVRYADVQIELKQIRAEISIIHQSIDNLRSYINSVKGYVNRKTNLKKEEDEPDDRESDLEKIRTAFGGVLPVELQHLDRKD